MLGLGEPEQKRMRQDAYTSQSCHVGRENILTVDQAARIKKNREEAIERLRCKKARDSASNLSIDVGGPDTGKRYVELSPYRPAKVGSKQGSDPCSLEAAGTEAQDPAMKSAEDAAKMALALHKTGLLQHGPAMTDHMADKVKWSGYYEMRNARLKEDGNKIRSGEAGTHASVYKSTSSHIHQAQPATQLCSSSSGADYTPGNFFQGVVAYINGKTGQFSAMHLTKLIQLHGGDCSWTFGKKRLTHVICENLSGRKTDQALNSGGKQIKFIRPEWVVDSIRAQKRLCEGSYLALQDSTVTRIDNMFAKTGKT